MFLRCYRDARIALVNVPILRSTAMGNRATVIVANKGKEADSQLVRTAQEEIANYTTSNATLKQQINDFYSHRRSKLIENMGLDLHNDNHKSKSIRTILFVWYLSDPHCGSAR